MRKYFILSCFLLSLSLNACQCSDKPEIGPIEGASLSLAK